MKKILKFISILEFITVAIYTVSVGYYADKMVEWGFIKKNYIYLISFSFVIIGGIIFIFIFFDKIIKKISKKI